MQDMTLYIQSFAACGPHIDCVPSIDQGRGMVPTSAWDNDWMPDTSFIPKRAFRRLSRLSKMAMYSAHHAVQGVENDSLGAAVFCSRYGEMNHTMSVLTSISSGDLVSPMDFSYSVHNTGQGLSSILTQDTRPATVISARYDAIEQALVKAYAQLKTGDQSVLIVYAEDKVPEIFHDLVGDNVCPLSFGVVVSLSPDEAKGTLTLSANPSVRDVAVSYDNTHANNVAMIIAKGTGQAGIETGRITWDMTVGS